MIKFGMPARPGVTRRRDSAPDDLQPRPREAAPMNSSRNEPASLAGHDEAVAGQNRQSGRARSRWAVHLALLITVIVALVPLLLFNVNPRVTVHVVIACVFLGLVIIHLAQRRHTLRRLIAQFARAGSRMKGRRLAVSGAIFGLLVANVLASGIFDLATGRNSRIELPGLRLFIGWHSLSSLLFLGYLIAHVIRRRKRLRRSRIR
jgi:Flp pilus assembly protein TadB